MAKINLNNTQTLEMLNLIRSEASQEYQNRIPEATKETINNWKVGLQNIPQLYNEFTGLLVRIGLTIVGSENYKNQLSQFKKGSMEFGGSIQDIYVDIIQAEGSFDPNGSNPLGRRSNEVHALYYVRNREDYYVTSISKQQVLNAFTSLQKINDFISAQMNAMYSGIEYDEFLLTKELLGGYTPFYDRYYVPNMITENVTADKLKTLVKTMRKAFLDMQFMSRQHNSMGVMRKTDANQIYLFVRKDILAELDIEVLASAFNIDKTDLVGRIIPLDDFGSSDNINENSDSKVYKNAVLSSKQICALMVTKDLVQIWDNLKEMQPQRNAQGLFENYFYHIWQVMSMRRYENAIAFVSPIYGEYVSVTFDFSQITTGNGVKELHLIDTDTNEVLLKLETDNAREKVNLLLPLQNPVSVNQTIGYKVITDNGEYPIDNLGYEVFFNDGTSANDLLFLNTDDNIIKPSINETLTLEQYKKLKYVEFN